MIDMIIGAGALYLIFGVITWVMVALWIGRDKPFVERYLTSFMMMPFWPVGYLCLLFSAGLDEPEEDEET